MNEQMIQEFRQRLSDGQKVIGPFMKTCDPAFVEAAGWAGMDFVILDMEHGPINIQNLQNNIRASQVAGVFPVVRVGSISAEAIGRALDIGAAAIEVPQICTAQDARRAIELARFHPLGHRGVCRFVRSAHYSNLPKEGYFRSANEILIIAQLEGTEAIKNLEDILEVPGIDILFIGPYDLSQSLGVPGQVTHPDVIRQMQTIVDRAKEKQITVGTFSDSPETLALWAGAGVQYIAYSVDVGLFTDTCRGLKKQFTALDTPLGSA